ncbi:MAG: class I adenylate-forming enzyme family protein [Syntrophales bacterium]|nr:class I adenylate-forming enzyme family protein [Syntrophales bacterium]
METSLLLHRLYGQALNDCPGKTAVVCGDKSCTYGELEQTSELYARALRSIGIGRSDLVGIFCSNRIEFVWLYLACFRIGAVAVPISAFNRAPEIVHEVEHSGLRVFLFSHDLEAEVRGLRKAVPALREVLVIDGPACETGESWQALVGRAAALPPTDDSDVRESDPAVVMYTSGSTSKPKGVTHTHGTLYRAASYRCATLHHDSRAVFLSAGQICHAAAVGIAFIPMLMACGTSVFLPLWWDAAAFCDAIERNGATGSWMLPSQAMELVLHPRALTTGFDSLEFCQAGGDVITRDLQERFRKITGRELNPSLGMSECFAYMTVPPSEPPRRGALGKPFVGVEVRLIDPDGREVPPGTPGEISVRSGAVMVGYWNDPEITASAVVDGWLRTGDIARRDEDGYYYFVCRRKDMIVRGGGNVGPGEVEDALCEHPAVSRCGVIGVPDGQGSETIQAFVVLDKDVRPLPTVQELAGFVGSAISDRKVPEFWTFVDELPLTGLGKVDRKALKPLVERLRASTVRLEPA